MSKGEVHSNAIIGVCDNLVSALLVKGYIAYLRPGVFEPTPEGRVVIGKMFGADGTADRPKV